MKLLSVVMATEIARAILYKIPSLMIMCIIFMIAIFAFSKLVNNVEKNQETMITCTMLLYYFSAICFQYHGSSGYFDHPNEAFYFGATSTMFERLTASRISNIKHRTIFSVCTAISRLLIVPTKDIGCVIVTILCLVMGIYLDMDYEKKDKELFRSYFNNQDQLIKFKNLVNNEIPEAIAIINTSLTDCLFSNNSFKKLTEQSHQSSIQTHLKEFILQKDSQPRSNPGSPIRLDDSSLENRTLFTFLQSNHQSLDSALLSTQRASIHITYTQPSQQTENRASNDQSQSNNHIFEAKILHIVWDEQPAIALILYDVTQQQTILSLRTADAYKDTLLATISHELRTPLNGILGMLQIMQKYVKDKDILKYINICKNSGHLLLGLVNSILDLNQIRAKKLKLYPERVNIDTFLKDISSLFEFQCTQKGIHLKVEVSPLVPFWIITDKNRLSQIFINLVGNALKFTSKGSITISVSPTDHSNYVELSVSDTGIGIKTEDKDKLFRMFGKLEDSDTTLNRQGVGLGLTISDNLARVLCCDSEREGIRLESEYNTGSRFYFVIKRLYKDTTEKGCTAPENLGEQFSMNCLEDLDEIDTKVKNCKTRMIKNPLTTKHIKATSLSESKLSMNCTENNIDFYKVKRTAKNLISPLRSRKIHTSESSANILIVDDNPLNIAVAEHLVSCQGYQVRTALYGQVAIDMILDSQSTVSPIRLILMDCQMPIMDGYETTRILRKLMEEKRIDQIPIIALTANDSEGDRETCIKAGMSDHLSKPLKETELAKTIKKYL